MNLYGLNSGKAYWVIISALSLLYLLGFRFFSPETLLLSIFAEAIISSFALLPSDIANFSARLRFMEQASFEFIRLVLRDAINILSKMFAVPLLAVIMLLFSRMEGTFAFSAWDFLIILFFAAFAAYKPKDPREDEILFFEMMFIGALLATSVSIPFASFVFMTLWMGLYVPFGGPVEVLFRASLLGLAYVVFIMWNPTAITVTIALFVSVSRFMGRSKT